MLIYKNVCGFFFLNGKTFLELYGDFGLSSQNRFHFVNTV